MERLIVRGGRRLHGTVRVAGNKNAAGPALAAALLSDEPVQLRNLPGIGDIDVFIALLRGLGVEIEPAAAKAHWSRRRRASRAAASIAQLGRQIRMSLLVAGPLLARLGHAELPPPGGDVIGRRRIDTHLLALQALGAKVDASREGYRLSAGRLHGADILLDEMSVTATENVLLAAVLADGRSIIRNAASEPHVQDLCALLGAMGARIGGVGTNCLVVDGVERLHGADFAIGPDYLEVGSFIGLAAVTRSALRIAVMPSRRARHDAHHAQPSRRRLARRRRRHRRARGSAAHCRRRSGPRGAEDRRRALARLPRRSDQHRDRRSRRRRAAPC